MSERVGRQRSVRRADGGLGAFGEAGRVAVVGSFNVDLVFSAPRMPLDGETLSGTAFGTFVGGKGANQAVAAARAGAQVEMIGRLGQDDYGRDVSAVLDTEGIGTRHVVRDPQEGTGVAGIIVQPDGTNSIIVVPRANGRLSAKDVQRARGAIGSASVLLLQLEVPLEATVAAAQAMRRARGMVILNPAPAIELPDTLLKQVDFLVPNETELRQLAGSPAAAGEAAAGEAAAVAALEAPADLSLAPDLAAAARRLIERGVGTVIVTLGERGAAIIPAEGEVTCVPAFAVRVIDTTAAGDAFCGALAVALAESQPLPDAVRFASAAGALACTILGAGPSLPPRHEIERRLAQSAE